MKKPDALAFKLLGGLVLAFALLAAAIPLVAPVPVELRCDRAAGTCTWQSGSAPKKSIALSALASARVEPERDGTRLVVDGEQLSNIATGEDVQAAHADAAARLKAFALGTAPELTVTYPVGGGAPRPGYWFSIAGAVAFGLGFLVRGLRAPRAAAT